MKKISSSVVFIIIMLVRTSCTEDKGFETKQALRAQKELTKEFSTGEKRFHWEFSIRLNGSF